MEKNIYKIRKELFITSDEEIKEGDNVILKSGRLTKAEISQGVLGFKTIDGVAFLYFQEGDKKVILTTDQDLIKDGVQAIDDTFLEWFVKNPSCESIEVKKGFEDGSAYGYNFLDYKILIPKQEQKQHLIDMMKSDEELGLYDKPKQQTTLEEVAKDIFKGEYICNGIDIVPAWREGFIEGAKWQQERNYSEEEVEFIKTLIDFYWSNYNNEHPNNLKDFELSKSILETFKNK